LDQITENLNNRAGSSDLPHLEDGVLTPLFMFFQSFHQRFLIAYQIIEGHL
jgi:hypothetical protein